MLYREFWEANYPVFPLWRANAGGCECGKADCAAPFKHPRISNWQHTPHWDEEQLDTMAVAGFFDTGYGVVCTDLIVVDVDARNGGIDSLSKLLEDVPSIAGAGLVVNTGSGGGSRHYYFKADRSVSFLYHLPQYPGIDFRSGKSFVVGPGSHHASGNKYVVADGTPDEIAPAPKLLLDLLTRPERHRTEYDGRSIDVSHQDIANMLAHIPNRDLPYDDWVKVGMAIHQATGGTGYELWSGWSATSDKHNDAQMGNRWQSFGKSANPVTIGTLIYHAEQNGWTMPVTFTPAQEMLALADDAPVDGLPFDIAGVDLRSPPGFTGDLARWIESQSRRPRATIAVAAALTAIGNIAGLRYIDDVDRVTPNMFCFCVAGSRTGKESIQQAVAQLHRVAGISAATHGMIKSEQEIYRNLVRHQAAFYIVDEVGIFLSKVKSAQQRGGALYLEGVIGALMSAYSKADGFLLLTGDNKEEVRRQLASELAQIIRKEEEGDTGTQIAARRKTIEHQLATLDNGLERPFLSLLGFTTPETFDGLVDHASATNGFIGRALLFNERDTAPRTKKNFTKAALPSSMEATLRAMCSGGEYDSQATRIEYYGDKLVVPTEPRARDMLAQALDWFEDQAIAHKSKTGLEALYLGAYELMAKVSLVLALGEGIRTGEHVRWAFAMIRRDIEEKARLVVSNEQSKNAPAVAIKARIENLCSGEEGESLSVIYNRMRPRTREEIDAAVAALEADGKVERIEVPTKRNGHTATYLRRVEG